MRAATDIELGGRIRPARVALWSGCAGSVAIAVASWRVGAVPVAWQVGTAEQAVFFALYYVGLALVIGAWLALARQVVGGDAAGSVRRFVLVVAAPLLAAAPLGRDLWAYAAQGHLVGAGLDPYRHGPADLPGVFADEVSARWAHTPSPYGPVWLQLCRTAAWLAHGQPLVAVLVLRLPAYLGLALACWALSRLTARLSGRVGAAMWLGLANPLVIVLGVGGGHNDVLMLGLALAGLALARGPRLVDLAVGAGLCGLAVLIKSPAVIAVAFTVPVWLAGRRNRSARQLSKACATAVAAGAAAVAAVTAVAGLGSGWVSQTNASAVWVSWLSLPSGVAMVVKSVAGTDPVREVDTVVRTCRTVGEIVLVLVVAALWVLAVRSTGRRPPTDHLALAWLAAAALAPAVQPWYYAWGVTVLAVGRRAPATVFAAAASVVALTVMITPPGNGWESDPRAFGVIALAIALCAIQPRGLWGDLAGRVLDRDDAGVDDRHDRDPHHRRAR